MSESGAAEVAHFHDNSCRYGLVYSSLVSDLNVYKGAIESCASSICKIDHILEVDLHGSSTKLSLRMIIFNPSVHINLNNRTWPS